jgi:hypothetical protein
MAESIDTHLAVIHRVVGSLREEGVTEQNKGEVAEPSMRLRCRSGPCKPELLRWTRGRVVLRRSRRNPSDGPQDESSPTIAR